MGLGSRVVNFDIGNELIHRVPEVDCPFLHELLG